MSPELVRLIAIFLAFTLSSAALETEHVRPRGVPSVRGGRTEPETPSPPSAENGGTGDTVGGFSSDGTVGGLSHSGGGTVGGLSHSGGGTVGGLSHLGDDTAESTSEYAPASKPNECLQHECAELSAEVAKELINQLLGNVLPSSSSSTPTVRLGGTAVQAPLPTAHATRSMLPNFNVAKTMTLDEESLALFDAEEQDMYRHDRMCFYAHAEGRYASMASANPTTTPLARRQNAADLINSAMTASASALPSDRVSSYQQSLWNTRLPRNLLSIYAPATANASMATATTTCSSLGNAPAITLPYIEGRVSSSSPTPTVVNDHVVDGGAPVQARVAGSALIAAVAAVLGLAMG